jgi:predicted pyridoxine 5'-phosphate oxidase superfamily flavin-nucleotide-binding protein
MGHQFAEIAFTETVRGIQQTMGSRGGYAEMEAGEDYNMLLGQHEAQFIAARDSFYMASVSETGWPYLQHRGGPAGFMRIVDERTLGFADFRGNRQYVSTGNFVNNDRVALFFMDYPNRQRLKVLGRVRLVAADETELLAQLEVDDYRARVERGFLIQLEAFDWNCPQHITPRYTQAAIDTIIAPVLEENRILKEKM